MTARRLPATIVTERLRLRPFEAADTEAYIAIRARPEVMRYMPGGVARAALAAEMAPQTIALFAQCWTRDGFGPWAVERRSDGRLIGHLGFRHLPERGETELLYLFDLGVWGNGFAREGGRAALAAWDAAGGGDLVGFSHRENRRSQNVLLALGFAATGPLEIFGVPATGFRRDAPQ